MRRRAGRSSICPGTSSASSTCARSMPAGRAKLAGRSRRWRWRHGAESPIAREAVALLRALFAVVKQAKEFSVPDRLTLRQTQSAPLLAELRQKLLRWKEQLQPKHPMAEAVNYTLGQWMELNVFCSDGAVPSDNSASYAACGIRHGMPTSGLCRHLNRGSGSTDVRTTCNRHNQRPSRKARRRSGGGTAPEELEWASARSLSCMSACK